jgi:biopolymer transport protein ExbB/TolQ
MIHELFSLFNWAGSEWVLVILMVLSVVVVAIVLQRYFEIRKFARGSNGFWKDAGDQWIQGNMPEGWSKEIADLKSKYPTSLEIDALEVVLRAKDHANVDPERTVYAYLQDRKMKMERFVGVLGTVGANAAFIGLLGTVLGIIRAFYDMSTKGIGAGVENIGGGIAEALVATAVGLFVAIPAVVFFNLLNRRITSLVRRAENVSGVALGRGSDKK